MIWQFECWSVAFDLEVTKGHTPITEAIVERLIAKLLPFSPAISYTPNRLNIRISVEVEDAEGAILEANLRVTQALTSQRFPTTRTLRVQAELESELDKSLTEPNFPALMGVAEAASLLGVTRQRVSELAGTTSFPRPLAALSAGPIWLESTLRVFQQTWDRKPGRPARRN